MLKVVRSPLCRPTDIRGICLLLSSKYNLLNTGSRLNVIRCIATKQKQESGSLEKAKPNSEVGSPITYERVKETTKTASYLGVILAGVGVTGIMFYAIFRELFSSKSSNTVYAKALDRCCEDTKVRFALGEPMKGFGEETRRGRRRHVNHLYYERDGINYLRMQFYIQGSRKKGTVHLEMQENAKGNFEYRYLFVQLDDYPRSTIILEDNRHEKSTIEMLPTALPELL